MGKIIVEQIVSADGYAAYKDGGIGFFDASGDFRDGENEQMKMLESVGAIVFGATTYRMFADYWPGADAKVERVAGPINSLPKFVVSNTLQSAPWGEKSEVEIRRGDGVESVRDLRHRIDGDLMIWGSLTLTDALFPCPPGGRAAPAHAGVAAWRRPLVRTRRAGRSEVVTAACQKLPERTYRDAVFRVRAISSPSPFM